MSWAVPSQGFGDGALVKQCQRGPVLVGHLHVEKQALASQWLDLCKRKHAGLPNCMIQIFIKKLLFSACKLLTLRLLFHIATGTADSRRRAEQPYTN